MNKFIIISISLLILGIFFFGIAGYCYWTILDLHESFGYYGLEEKDYLLSANVSETLANLKYAIVKFLIFGMTAWILGFVFFLKRNKKVLTK